MNIQENSNPINEHRKSEALDFILENAFKSGFGTIGKSELDLILFTALIKYSNHQNASDNDLSKYLQITKRRITSLREKASVKYILMSFDKAIEIFLRQLDHAKIDDKYIDIPIYDVAVKNEIEAMLEENNILLHIQLNQKIFRIRVDDCLEFALLLEKKQNPSNETESEIDKRVLNHFIIKLQEEESYREKLNIDKEAVNSLTKKTLKEGLVKGGLSVGIDLLASAIPGGAFLSTPAKTLLKKISEKI